MTRAPLGPLAAVLLALVAAPAGAQGVEARLADLRLATAVRLALVDAAETRALDVDVVARDGAVALSGPDAANGQAERVARGVPGVRSVGGASPAPGAPGVTAPEERADEERPRASSGDASDGPTGGETPTVPARPPSSAPGASPGAAPRAWGAAPPAREAAPDDGPAHHTVARGETLFSLARRYRTTVDALRRLNGLGPTDGIEVGRRLRLR